MLISNQKLKVFSIQTLLITDFVVLFLFIIFYLARGVNSKSVVKIQKPKETIKPTISLVSESLSPPVQLIIPIINVNTNIQPLGVTPKGEMEVPENIVDVGWFKFGPIPGEIGSAVIAGHLNGKKNETGVFANLNKLKKGDQIFIKNDKDQSITFIVKQIRLYNPGYAESIFSSNDNAHLNLITCDGTWDKIKQTYSKRLVVLAEIAN